MAKKHMEDQLFTLWIILVRYLSDQKIVDSHKIASLIEEAMASYPSHIVPGVLQAASRILSDLPQANAKTILELVKNEKDSE